MKKLLTFIMSLLMVSAMFGQAQVTPFAKDLGYSARPIGQTATRCDIELPAYEQPNDDNNVFLGLHSTDGTVANGGVINLGMSEDFNIPQIATHGVQIISSVQVAGYNNGNAAGMPFRIEIWSDVTGAPGVMMAQDMMSGINPAGFQSTLDFETPASWSFINVNTNYWLSCVGLAEGRGGVTRWFWGTTRPQTNGGEEFSVYYNYTGNGFGGQFCDQWTTVSQCGVVSAGVNMGAAFKFNLCQNAQLDLGGSPVPTMTQWGLFLFGLIVLTLGVVSIYNFSRKRVAE